MATTVVFLLLSSNQWQKGDSFSHEVSYMVALET
jgi:hypothetical protein